MQSISWHTLTRDETYERLNTNPQGLTSVEAVKRLLVAGPNELQAVRRISPWEILLDQFKNVLILILLAATAISLLLEHGVESIVIGVIVLFAVLLGFVQEYRAERAIEALRKMAAPTATVLRDGVEVKIPARDLVPGDVILLHTGDRVPADAALARSGKPSIGGSRAHWRIGSGGEGYSFTREARSAVGRPQEHGLCRHGGHLWAWAGIGCCYRHEDRIR